MCLLGTILGGILIHVWCSIVSIYSSRTVTILKKHYSLDPFMGFVHDKKYWQLYPQHNLIKFIQFFLTDY